MITDKHKELARWAMDFALRHGCQACKVTLYANSSSSFELRNGRTDRLQQASERGLGISLYVDGRYGNYSTNRLDRKELEGFIAGGIESTRYLAADEARALPAPSRYYKGGKPDLQLFDARIVTLSPDVKVDLARAAADEVLSLCDSRVISVDTSYSDGESHVYRLMSNGFEGGKQSTWCCTSASVSVKGEGEARPSDYWSESRLHFDELPQKGIGLKALERTLQKLGQRKARSGQYTMLVDNLNAGTLLSPMVDALYGSALQQRNSFLMDKLGQQVASGLLTLTDEPHLRGAFGARYFDSEGVATEHRPVFEEGVLRTYFIDTYRARKMGVEPTIGSPSVLVLRPGTQTLDELVAGVEKGILVTGFNGGNCNSSTGDFSYGVEGFLVENGRLAHPVGEMNVTGNMVQLWHSLSAVGCDPLLFRSWRLPSLVFQGVDFSGC